MFRNSSRPADLGTRKRRRRHIGRGGRGREFRPTVTPAIFLKFWKRRSNKCREEERIQGRMFLIFAEGKKYHRVSEHFTYHVFESTGKITELN